MWDHWNVPVCAYDPTGEYDNEINFVADFAHNNKPRLIHCDTFNPGIHFSTLLTNSALNFLQNKKPDVPFFLHLSYLAPHDPRTMPKKYKAMYPTNSLKIPPNYQSEHSFTFGVEKIRDECLIGYPRTKNSVVNELADYYAMITHLDEEIGKVLHELEQQDLTNNTLIIFTSDNGLCVGSHGLMGKQNLYEESVRVPLLICGPGIPHKKTCNNLLYLLDIFPTICELMGFDIPHSVEGKSFLSLLLGENKEIRESLYFAYNDIIRGIKQGDIKLIEYAGKVQQTQLFDLTLDPYEMHDISCKNPSLVKKNEKPFTET